MKKYIIIFIILCVGLYFFLNRNNKPLKQEIDSLELYQKKRAESGKSLDKKIQIYGKVIDGESGKPLPGVLLEVIYDHSSPIPPLFFSASMVKVTSDENGLFFIDNIVGRSIYLNKIAKENYWERAQKNFFSGSNLINYVPDKENPFIFKLYKEVKDNYLLSASFVISPFVKDGETKIYYYNILKQQCIERELEGYDFQCKVKRIGSKTIINLKGFDETCSFFLSDKEFLSGDELSSFKNILEIEKIKNISITKDEEILHHLYVRFNKLQLYAKVKFKIDMSTNSSLLKFNFTINPYGEYYFEKFDDSKINSSILVKIDRDFEKKIKQGILPKKTDLKQFLDISLTEVKKKPSKTIK